MNEEFFEAVSELKQEKELDEDVVLEAFESALIKACRKDFDIPDEFDVEVNVNFDEGIVEAYAEQEVVRTVIVPDNQVNLETAREHDEDVDYGERVMVPLDTDALSRTATQVLKQEFRERIDRGEQRQQKEYFEEKMFDLINGVVQRQEEKSVFVRLDKDVEALLPYREQVDSDDYRNGNRMKFLIVKVALQDRGLLVVVSRSHPTLIERLFELHIPEVHDGLVEVIDVAREAGTRSKVAVRSNDPSLDPIGTCVGPQGSRINSIVQEINGEKIDIIPHEQDDVEFIKNALSPAEVSKVKLVEDEDTAQVVVPEDQLSLAIGKGGQNARLTAKLCGWSIDIYSEEEFAALKSEEALEVAASIFKDTDTPEDEEFELTEVEGVGPSTAENLEDAELDTPAAILEGGEEALQDVKGIGESTAETIYEDVASYVQDEVTGEEDVEESKPESAEEVKESIFQDSDEEAVDEEDADEESVESDEDTVEEETSSDDGEGVSQMVEEKDDEEEEEQEQEDEDEEPPVDVFEDGEAEEESESEDAEEDSTSEAEEIWQ
jgi:N utilization substance protein A